MRAVVNIYKPQGMTPLQTLDALRSIYPEYAPERMTYAGRLDPMAEGVLLVLVGDAVMEKESYCGLDKTYEADIIFGMETDTHDLLGMPTMYAMKNVSKERLEEACKALVGVQEYALPIYSSKPVKGRPLFQWAREKRTHEIDVPRRAMCVHEIVIKEQFELSVDVLRKEIMERIGKVRGDFRQENIVAQWNALLDQERERTYRGTRIVVRCASGTYIRTLAHELGKRLGGDAVLMRLVRTSVGPHMVGDGLRFDKDGMVGETGDSN